jgi:predicted TIM-barrel fold metal-dependent hydrolase
LPSLHSEHWNPFFAAVEAAGFPVCMHFGSSGRLADTSPEAPLMVTVSLLATNAQICLAELIFSPIMRRFPALKFALSEGGIGWIPYMLERMDRQWERYRWADKRDDWSRPSDLFRERIWGCTIEEQFGLEVRDRIGADRIMLESDYPHADTSWPHTRKLAAELLENVPDDEVERIAWKNASELFRFPLPAPAG